MKTPNDWAEAAYDLVSIRSKDFWYMAEVRDLFAACQREAIEADIDTLDAIDGATLTGTPYEIRATLVERLRERSGIAPSWNPKQYGNTADVASKPKSLAEHLQDPAYLAEFIAENEDQAQEVGRERGIEQCLAVLSRHGLSGSSVEDAVRALLTPATPVRQDEGGAT